MTGKMRDQNTGKQHAVKTSGGVHVQLHTFITSASDGDISEEKIHHTYRYEKLKSNIVKLMLLCVSTVT
jgi:hypothetical protein